MNLAWLSLGALFLAIVISCTTKLNVGVISIAMAWIIGVYAGGFRVEEIAAGFPGQLFLTLAGVTMLFTQAQNNGTLDKIAHRAVFLCRGNAGLIPVMFFVLAAGLASIGPGNIATAALMAPMAMAVAGRAGVPAFLMAIMVGNGANAGSLSPFAPTGIIVNGLMSRIGMPGMAWESYSTNLAAHALVAFTGYALFGGLRLFRLRYEHTAEAAIAADARGSSAAFPSVSPPENAYAFDRRNWVTVAAIGGLILGVIVLKIHVGMGAFAAAVLLALLGAADHVESIRKIPWNAIVMVCGVTVLIALLERTQGLTLFTDLLARIATHKTVTAMIAFLTGLISVYSSTRGRMVRANLISACRKTASRPARLQRSSTAPTRVAS
jgi:di/tricarboxylate transporter